MRPLDFTSLFQANLLPNVALHHDNFFRNQGVNEAELTQKLRNMNLAGYAIEPTLSSGRKHIY